MTVTTSTLLTADAAYVWHPFTQAATSPTPLPIVRGQGATLFDVEGKAYIDAISSWWVTVHGHSHPILAEALANQAQTLDHVQFASATHPQAVQLAKRLSERYPKAADQEKWRCFYSDNGSTAVEVALKVAYQYWQQSGQPQRTRFLALDGGYHGDTVGAMSVGFSSGFYEPFAPLCFPVHRLPCPFTWLDDPDIETKEAQALKALDNYLAEFGETTAAFIGEPLLQGAAGMRITRPSFWNAVIAKLKASGVLVILDEVLTGFGRTGTLFATEQFTGTADLVCLSKGITGGMLPLGVTLATETLYNAFNGNDFSTAFAHGHSYTANPIICAVANASLALFETEQTLQRIADLNSVHQHWLTKLAKDFSVFHPRHYGLIAAMELGESTQRYDHPLRPKLYQRALAAGILLRPLGNTLYLLPPACMTPDELDQLYQRLATDVLPAL